MAGRQGAESELSTHSITLRNGATAYWLVHDSPTTQVVGDGIEGNKHRSIRWGSGGLYASSRRTYAVFGFKLLEGNPGRMYDWHTQPNDIGGWTPLCSNGVAPLAIDYWGDSDGLMAVVQPEDTECNGSPPPGYVQGSGNFHFRILTQSEIEARRGQWVWLWAEITWGRRDLSTKGSLKVWVAGEHTPRVNASGINTHWPQQEMVTFWEGQYHCSTCSGQSETHEVEIAATRFGRTREEAYADAPVLYEAKPAGTPGGSSARIAPRLSTEAVFLPDSPGRRRVLTDKGCRIVSATRGRLEARIAGARDDRDTAIVTHLVRQRDEVVLSYKLRVVGHRLTSRLVVTQLSQPDGRVLAEIYATRRGTLRLSIPAGGLRRRGYDASMRVAVAEAPKLEIRLSSNRLLLAIAGRSIVDLEVRGPRRGTLLRARIGIDRYEGSVGDRAIRAVYDQLVVGSA